MTDKKEAKSGKELPLQLREKMPPTDIKPMPYTGPPLEDVLKDRKTYMFPNLVLYYKKPIMIVEGKMQWVFDEKGKRYLDAIGGIVTVSVGHCHPDVVAAGVEQMHKIHHTSPIYLNPEPPQFAKNLCNHLPPELRCVYFVNSGTEANDLAILLARNFTKNFDWISLRNCYHGGGGNALALTSVGTWLWPVPQPAGFHKALCPDLYQGAFRANDPEAVDKYVNDVASIIKYCTAGKVAGFHAEPIQGVGGVVEMPEGYLKRVYDLVHAAGGLCVSDEVQTGFGRTGTNFWGFQNHGVIPDIVTMAKGIGSGVPLAAVACRPEIAAAFNKIHFNTFGGDPLCSAMGNAVLNVMDKANTQKNCLEVGTHLLNRFKELQKKYPLIGDVRGKGLMLGVEMVKDPKTRVPASAETMQIFENMKELGVLVGKGGIAGNVLRIKPPMCITKADADFIAETLDAAIAAL